VVRQAHHKLQDRLPGPRSGLDLAIQTEQNLAIQTKHNEIDGFSTFSYFF
jgi:hypothetical protein